MSEQDFISKKMPILIKEGYKKAQAFIIAKSMFSKMPKAQEGIDLNKPTEQDLALYHNQQAQPNQGIVLNPNDNVNIGNTQSMIDGGGDYSMGATSPEMQRRLSQNKYYNTINNNYDENGNAMPQNDQDINRLQIYNPYGGIGLEQSLFTLGQGIGEKDALKTGVGAGLSLLKIGRTGLAGVASGKENNRVYDEMYKKLYTDNTRPEMLQEGGGINIADLATGKYLVNNPNGGNIEIEGGEHVKDNQTGNIQEVIGDKHKDGGVQAELDDSKILSDYTKIGAKNAKQLKEKYQVSLKATDTYATVMDKVNRKIGVDEHTKEQAEYIEKLEENEAVKDKTTKRLNEVALTKEIQEHESKLEALKGAQNFVFEDLFKLQEAQPKKGDGKTILDDKGKPLAQEGGYTMTAEEERRSQAPQMPIARVMQGVITNEVKEGNLPPGKYTRVDYNNNTSDYLTPGGFKEFQKMNNYRLYMEQQAKKQNTSQPLAVLQEGGDFSELASKYNISTERVQELLAQEGGQMQAPQEEQSEPTPEQIIQYFAQLTGKDPQAIMQQLQSMKPEEQQQALMQMMQTLQQGQQQNPQEEQAEGQMSNPQEEEQEIAQEGGYTKEQKDKRLTDYFNQITNLGYSGKKDIGEMQKWAGQNYPTDVANYFIESGQPMTAKHIDIVKSKYKDAFKQAGISDSKSSASYTKEEKDKLKTALGDKANQDFWVEGFQDNKWDWRFPLIKSKEDAKVSATKRLGIQAPMMQQPNVTPETPIEQVPQEVSQNGVRTVMPSLPVDFLLPPSPMQAIAKENINLGRIDPIKQTVEPYLAEQERQRVTVQEQSRATGLPPQIQEALAAQQLASGQIASNDAIGKVETFNAGQQFQADQFNIGQRAKEDITNANFNQDYQNKMMQTIANQERDIRRYFNENNDIQNQNFNWVDRRNLANAMNEQYQTDGNNVYFMDNKAKNLGYTPLSQADFEKMTAQEQMKYTMEETARLNQAKAKKSYTSK